jgi:hypothetical protein
MPPFAPNGFAPAGSGLGSAAPARRPSSNATVNLAVDNMIRNQLKVSDVRDPKQIADALLNYYRDLPIAAAVLQEAQGLPFLQAAPVAALPPQPTSSDAEFRIADGDVEKALTDLTTNPLSNDIVPEMQGWADSIRSAIAQGYTAARQGLDPTQRDMVFAIRRQLGEYGRMARFVGSLSPGMTFNYRRLGQALDEVSAVLLVMLGESLASVGFASGYYLLQVPLAELQQRRDAVIFALRNFMGGAQQAYGPDDWPRGIDAYRRLYRWLEEQGQGDLRSLLIENEIAQSMDSLINRAQNGTAEGLRALGVTAQLDIERFRRMAIVAPGAMSRDGHYDRSPPLEAYLQALELFAETFRPAGGLRLLRIARPPILFYGIYNPNTVEDDRDLVELIMVRGNLATTFDSLFPASGARSVEPQVLLDMLLLELDRGIDLLALDANPRDRGPTTRRAVAYWLIVRVILRLVLGGYGYNGLRLTAPQPVWAVPILLPNTSPPPPSPGLPGPIATLPVAGFPEVLRQIALTYQAATSGVTGPDRAFAQYEDLRTTGIPTTSPPVNQEFLEAVLEELRVQESLEERWQNLVRTVAPEAGNQQSVFELLRLVIRQAQYDAEHLVAAVHVPPIPFDEALPPQYEQTLERILGRI